MLTTELAKSIHKMAKQPQPPISLDPFNSEKSSIPLAIKIAVGGALLLSVLSFLSAIFMSRSVSLEKSERVALEAARIQLQDQIDALRQENENLVSQVTQLRDKLKTDSVENAKLKKDLDQAYLDVANAKKKIDATEAKNQELASKIEKLAAAAKKEFIEPAASSSGIETYAVEVPTATSIPTILETAGEVKIPVATQEVASVKEKVAVGNSETSGYQVMTVNRRFNFVVVNLGMKEGLKMGDKLAIQRNNKTLATVQVEKLYDHFAAATIISEAQKDQVDKGDLVTRA